MGTTYYVNTKTDLFGVYICSKCKSPQILHFHLLGAGASTWSQKKAKEALEEPTQNLLTALQNFREKPFLLSKKYNGRTFTTGYEVGFANEDHHCPYCDNHEIWQRGDYYADACKTDPETNVPLVADCPEESRMLVFSSLDSATTALKKLIALKDLEFRQYWANRTGEAEGIKAQITFLKSKIANLEPQKAIVREKSNRLNAQMAEKEAEMKRMSLFSSEKKAAKAELKELKSRYEAQRDADILEERRLKGEIESFEKQLKDLKIANPGILGEIDQVSADGEFAHIVFRLS